MYNPQLETFLCVAECGSFNKAAEKLFISPPAVIKQINLLEENLDFEESSILRAQLLLPNYIKDITLNREGEVLSTPLYTADERQFRRSLRELLEKEE